VEAPVCHAGGQGFKSPRRRSMSTWSNGEDAGLRNRRVQVRPLPSTLSTRRSSAGSERRSPKAEVARSNRAGGTHALVAQEALVEEAIRLDEEPCSKHGTGASPWAFESPRFRGRTVRWCGNCVGSAASPVRAMGVRLSLLPPSRDRPAVRTPGHQSGNRGSLAARRKEFSSDVGHKRSALECPLGRRLSYPVGKM
jgi:hypothetical protein